MAQQTRAFTSTPSPLAPPPVPRGRPTKGEGRRRNPEDDKDPRITNLLNGLRNTYTMPAPLRMARNRHLRHWTIHRAWMLYRRQQRAKREGTLMKQYQAMREACEALRTSSGPGTRPEGYLYRVAMEKKGVYGRMGVPIEYARAQTETPAREVWNHDWKP